MLFQQTNNGSGPATNPLAWIDVVAKEIHPVMDPDSEQVLLAETALVYPDGLAKAYQLLQQYISGHSKHIN
ncbi:MAG: hypothetical protein COU69_02190 [Candidatus Pacebacteria bacterium CG10_big_fil_rev_8_21_14_0_10_56_10]|nr:MAG: hypothetical protein COU69_02190 [Candidatus Pacebacteria bacterium CG10_big_fil_rev_8_21_14_0_10_56_10]